MKTSATILASLLCALPATAVAQPNEGHYSPAAQQNHVQVREQVTVRQQTSFRYEPRPVQPMPQYQARQSVAYYSATPVYRYAPMYGAWHWNGGVAWVGIPHYWGAGFWGDFAIGLPIATYNVAPASPGAQLLANYSLTQGPCDQDNMVQVYGPDNSEICAYPNNLVSPGQYQIDMSNLSLVSF
jgi:hypothetical protein